MLRCPNPDCRQTTATIDVVGWTVYATTTVSVENGKIVPRSPTVASITVRPEAQIQNPQHHKHLAARCPTCNKTFPLSQWELVLFSLFSGLPATQQMTSRWSSVFILSVTEAEAKELERLMPELDTFMTNIQRLSTLQR